MTEIMVTGGSGKLGKALLALFPNSLHPSHAELELSERATVFSYIEKHSPDIIIHAAALDGHKRMRR